MPSSNSKKTAIEKNTKRRTQKNKTKLGRKQRSTHKHSTNRTKRKQTQQNMYVSIVMILHNNSESNLFQNGSNMLFQDRNIRSRVRWTFEKHILGTCQHVHNMLGMFMFVLPRSQQPALSCPAPVWQLGPMVLFQAPTSLSRHSPAQI